MLLGINKTVEIYGQKATYGALLVAVLGMVIGAIMIFNGVLYAGILTLLMYGAASFTINCAVLGQCNKWGIFLVFGNVIMAVSAIAGAVGLAKKK